MSSNPEPSDDASQSPRKHSRLDVLVVDDDASSRRGISLELAHLGHTCRLASDGIEALEMHAARRADVILSDWQMPNMPGDELCRRIRSADHGVAYTYFIMMTAFGDRDHLMKGMEAGADHYQVKPLDLDAFEGHLVSAARVLALHRGLAGRQLSLLRNETGRLNPAAVAELVRLQMNDEIELIFANARRYKRRCCAALCALEEGNVVDAVSSLRLLDDAAEQTRSALRQSDAFFRIDERELLIILTEQDLRDTTLVMERARARIAKLGLQASIGISQIEPFDETAAAWLRRTERALTNAKEAGGGTIAIDA